MSAARKQLVPRPTVVHLTPKRGSSIQELASHYPAVRGLIIYAGEVTRERDALLVSRASWWKRLRTWAQHAWQRLRARKEKGE